MKEIPLTRGQFAIIDDEEYSDVVRFKWYAKKTNGVYYVYRTIPMNDDYGAAKEPLHRRIMRLGSWRDSPVMVDHINRNPLDNRKRNLRFTTRQGNRLNSRTLPKNKN